MRSLAKSFTQSAVKAGTIDVIRAALGNFAGSGRSITVTNAIQIATVFSCLRVIGEGVAQVPKKLMRESADGSTRLPVKDHPLYNILALKPNSWQTSFEYMEMLVWHAGLCGNHYSFINRGTKRQILELIPFTPAQVTTKRDKNYTITYEVRADDGSSRTFPAETIWHVRGPSWDGWNGQDILKQARNAIGLAMSTEESSNALHSKGVRPSGVYSVDGTLKPDQYKDLAAWIDEHHAGAANAGKPLILDRAAKWTNTQMTGVDAQSYETRRFQIEEVCRYFRVMPVMVGHTDKAATYASAEQMFLAHVVHTLAPWYERLEESIDVNLLTDEERASGLYSNFVEEGLLRGSAKDTKDVILGYVNGGVITPNEGRAKLDLNPDNDPASDKLRIPANITGSVPDSEPAKEEQV